MGSTLGPAWAALRPRGVSYIFTTGASMVSSLAQGRFLYFHHWGQHGQLFGQGEFLIFSPLGPAWAALWPRGDSFIFTTGASMGSSSAKGSFFYFHHWAQHGQLFGPGERFFYFHHWGQHGQ